MHGIAAVLTPHHGTAHLEDEEAHRDADADQHRGDDVADHGDDGHHQEQFHEGEPGATLASHGNNSAFPEDMTIVILG